MDAEILWLEDSDFVSIRDETSVLVDRALASVRATAKLDDDPVLFPLPRLAPRRHAVVLSCEDMALPSPAEIALGASRARAAGPVEEPGSSRRPERASAPSSSWAMLLCGFVASVATGAALVSSPLAHRPAVEHAKRAAHAKMSAAVYAAAHLVNR